MSDPGHDHRRFRGCCGENNSQARINMKRETFTWKVRILKVTGIGN